MSPPPKKQILKRKEFVLLFPLTSSKENKSRVKKKDVAAPSCSLLCARLSSSALRFCVELPFKDGILIWPRVMPWKSGCSGLGSCSRINVELDSGFKHSEAVRLQPALELSDVKCFSKAWVQYSSNTYPRKFYCLSMKNVQIPSMFCKTCSAEFETVLAESHLCNCQGGQSNTGYLLQQPVTWVTGLSYRNRPW